MRDHKFRFKYCISRIHRWLGVISGLVVFIVAITGCIYTFKTEIENLTQPYRFVDAQQKEFLSPSEIQSIAQNELPGRTIHSVLYEGKRDAVKVIFYEPDPEFYYLIFVNPYSGEVLKVQDVNSTFFDFILDGHYNLWLPKEIGQTIVASATLIFVFMLISGIILWWPKKKNKKQRFKIKWNARWRRKNFDLHSVIGFYLSWIVIIIAITGLVWGFQWFESALYQSTGGNKSLTYQDPGSDTSQTLMEDSKPIDRVWQMMKEEYPKTASIEVHPAPTPQSTIMAAVNPTDATIWDMDYRFFDQYTLEEKSAEHHIWGKLENADGADKFRRMNYDIHIGAILGLPGKILIFFVSLLTASLPITGVLMWIGRSRKNKRQPARRNYAPRQYSNLNV